MLTAVERTLLISDIQRGDLSGAELNKAWVALGWATKDEDEISEELSSFVLPLDDLLAKRSD